MDHVGFTTQRSYFEAALFKAALDFYEIEGEFNALQSFVDRYAVPDKDDMLEEASEDDEGDEGLDEEGDEGDEGLSALAINCAPRAQRAALAPGTLAASSKV